MIDLHYSFVDLGQLHRTCILVVHIYLSFYKLVEDTSPMWNKLHQGPCENIHFINAKKDTRKLPGPFGNQHGNVEENHMKTMK